MNALSKTALFVSALAVAQPQAATAQSRSLSKDWAGTWRLDTKESKFSSAEFTPKSETRTYRIAGPRLTLHSDGINAAGKKLVWGYSAKADGKWYSTSGNPNSDQVALTFVSPRELKSKTRLKGKPSANSTLSLSADGKMLTVRRSILTAKGGPTDDTVIYRRSK